MDKLEYGFKIMNENQCNNVFLNKIYEIRRALDLELYNCALALALTLPDVCGKVEFPGESNKKRYKGWFEKYAQSYFTALATQLPGGETIEIQWISSEECYALRCAVLHAGDYKTEGIKLSQISFHAHRKNGENYNHMVRNRVDFDADVIDFCEKLCLAAEEYFNSIEDKSKFDLDEVRIDTW